AVAITCDIGGWSWWINFRMGGGIMPDAWTSQSSHAMLELGLGPCKNMFEALMDEADFEYGTIGSYKSADVDEEKFDYWLLNCTYFSNSGSHKIPSGIPGVEYEETDKGVYLSIGNKLCISTDDPEYQEQK